MRKIKKKENLTIILENNNKKNFTMGSFAWTLPLTTLHILHKIILLGNGRGAGFAIGLIFYCNVTRESHYTYRNCNYIHIYIYPYPPIETKFDPKRLLSAAKVEMMLKIKLIN